MQLRHLERLVGQVDAQHLRAAPRHRIGQDAAAAAHVQHLAPGDRRNAFDPLQPQRIDFVQRAKFAFQIPPAVGQFGEFGQFGRIGIHDVSVICAIMKRRELP